MGSQTDKETATKLKSEKRVKVKTKKDEVFYTQFSREYFKDIRGESPIDVFDIIGSKKGTYIKRFLNVIKEENILC